MSDKGTAESRGSTLTVAEVARRADCTPDSVRNAISAGRIDAEKVGGRGASGGEWAVSKESAERWIDARNTVRGRRAAAIEQYGTVADLHRKARGRALAGLAGFAAEYLERYSGLVSGEFTPEDAAAFDAETESALRICADRFSTARAIRGELLDAYAAAAEADSESKAADALERVDA